MLHDERARADIIGRIEALGPGSRRRWGRMTLDQMLWHLNQALLTSLGQLQVAPMPVPLGAAGSLAFSLAKPLAFTLPWPHGLPTAPEWRAQSEHDLEGERRRCLLLIGDFSRRSLDDRWPPHPLFGAMSGRDWSRGLYRHTDHHLSQFSV